VRTRLPASECYRGSGALANCARWQSGVGRCPFGVTDGPRRVEVAFEGCGSRGFDGDSVGPDTYASACKIIGDFAFGKRRSGSRWVFGMS
jgi:hypothetical protein